MWILGWTFACVRRKLMSRFLRGEDIILRFDGEVAGGVERAEIALKTTTESIMEFLNDEAVHTCVTHRYELVFEVCVTDLAEVSRLAGAGVIEVESEGLVERYADCVAVAVNTTVAPNKKLSCVLKFEAKKE